MKRFVLGLALFAAAVPASATNLVTNGDFETGDFTGWFVDGNWNVVPQQDLFGSYETAGFNVEGNTLAQIFAVAPGQQYTLSYYFAGGTADDPATVGCFFLGTVCGATSTSDSAQQFSMVLTASLFQTRATLQLSAGTELVRLDNVSVTPVESAVPEPATWAMMLVGFGLIGGALRRRRTVMRSHA